MKKNNNKFIGIVAFFLLFAVAIVMSAVGVTKATGLSHPVTFGDVQTVNINVAADQADAIVGDNLGSDSHTVSTIHASGFASDGAIDVGTTLDVAGETQLNTLVQGGSVFASSSYQSDVLTAAQICNNSVIDITVKNTVGTTEAYTVTLPATSTLAADCFGEVGKSKTIIFSNLTATAATTTTIVKGDGIELLSDDANGDIIAGLDSAKMTIVRVSATSGNQFLVTLDPYTPAD